MSKSLIKRISTEAGISKKEAEIQLKNVFGSIKNELLDTGYVAVKDFGSLNKSRFQKKTILFKKEYLVDTNVIRFNIFKKLKAAIN